MASNVIADFLVRLAYNLDKKSKKDAEESVDKLGGLVDDLSDKLDKLKDTFAVVAASWAGSKVLGYVTSTAEKFDQLGQAAQRVGAESAESLASLQYAFAQAGVEVDTLNDGLANLTDIIGQAKLGEGEGLEVFQKLGIDITDANGQARDTLAIFDELTAKLGSLDHATQVAYINMLGLDTEMIQGMSQSSDELKALRDEYIKTYEAAGVSINESVKQSQAFNRSLKQLQTTFEVITNAVGTKFLGTATQTFDQLRKYLILNVDKITLVLSGLVSAVGAVAKSFIALGKTAFDVVSGIIDWWMSTSPTFRTVIKLIGGATAAMLLLNSAFMKSPIGKLLALAAAVGLVLDDIQAWQEGGNSVLGELIGSFDEVSASLAEISPILSGILPYVDNIVLALVGIPLAFKGIRAAASLLSTPFLGWARNVIGLTLKVMKAFGTLGAFLTKFGGMVLPVLAKLGAGLGALVKIVGALTLGLVKMGAAFLATPIGWLVAGITALIAAGVLLYKNWDTVKEYLLAAWDAIVDAFNSGVEWVQNLFAGLGSWLSRLPDLLMAPWAAFFDWLSSKFEWLANAVDAVKSGAKKVINFFTGGDEEDDVEAPAPNQEAAAAPVAQREQRADDPVAQLSRWPRSQAAQVEGYQPPVMAIPELPALSPKLEQAAQNTVQNFNLPAAAPATIVQPAAPTNVTQNNTGDTNIIIKAASNPQQTAEAVAAQQSMVRSDAVRNLRRNFA